MPNSIKFKSILDFPLEYPKKYPSILEIDDTDKEGEYIYNEVFLYNKSKAKEIFSFVDEGICKFSNATTEIQLLDIIKGENIFDLNPNTYRIEILEVITFILNKAKKNNFKEIAIGSFIRTNSDGHKSGRSIDINCSDNNWDTSDVPLNMVVFILNQLLELSKFTFGIGLPYQGKFIKEKTGQLFKSVPKPEIIDKELNKVIERLLIQGSTMFPDNNNHLHIQIRI